jgi:pyridoxamine 5'-phosphate oxidase
MDSIHSDLPSPEFPNIDAVTNPLDLFREWMEDAKRTEINDPNAMSLATCTLDGRPSVRIVLLKRFDEHGFCFYTNGDSRKGAELRANHHAALALHWKSLRRQVRVEGPIRELPAADIDAYFRRRHRMSQIGAWASQQSRPLASREELIARTEEFEAKFPGEVPRPPYWTGFSVKPESIELWQERDFRLHDRVLFHAAPDAKWTRQRLYP